MKVTIKGKAKEVAALVLAVQERQKISQKSDEHNERNALIREYEHRLAQLKDGTSPTDIIL